MNTVAQTPIHIIKKDRIILEDQRQYQLLHELYELIGIYLERHKHGQPYSILKKSIEQAMRDYAAITRAPVPDLSPLPAEDIEQRPLRLEKLRDCIKNSKYETMHEFIRAGEFSRHTIYDFLSGKSHRLMRKTMDKICWMLQKTPDELGMVKVLKGQAVKGHYIAKVDKHGNEV